MTNILETVLTLSVLLLPFLDCWHKYLRFIELFPVFSSDLLSASECWFRNGNCCSCLSAPRLLLSAMFVWSRNVRFCPFLSVYVTHHVCNARAMPRQHIGHDILMQHVDMCWGACTCCILVPRVLLSIHVAQRCNGCFKERFTITTLHQADTRAKRQWGRDSAWKTTRSKSCQCIHVLQVSTIIIHVHHAHYDVYCMTTGCMLIESWNEQSWTIVSFPLPTRNFFPSILPT